MLLHTSISQTDLQRFVHPGMLHSASDLRRMREAVRDRAQPIYAGFEKLRDDPHSKLSYKLAGASEEVGRNPTLRANALENDANAAYQLALMGHITADPQYFKLCASILDDWANTLKRITGADAVLCAGLSPFKMANAAELLRSSNGGWPETNALRFAKLLREVVLPVIENFAPFANGNWDTAALKTMMAIAIFAEDRELLDRALVYYMNGCGDGRLDHYIYANGQCQESGRDQQHTQLGLAHMGDCCEMAWHQGLDLYGQMNNRLLLGFEYTARYEVGEEVPFIPDIDQTGKYRHKVISPRSPLRPVYEQIYNHYAMRRGLPAPWTAKAAAQIRPEGPGFGADHTGFGTLLYSRPAGEPIETVPSALPAGLYASDVKGPVRLSWVPLSVASSSTLIRNDDGEMKRIAVQGIASEQIDPTAVAGHAYQYRVVTNGNRSSSSVSAIAGLPPEWTLSSIDDGALPSAAFFSGRTWRMSAASGGNANDSGGLAFLARHLPQGTMFSARLLPMFASQQLNAGIACIGENGAAAVLLLAPAAGSAGESVSWAVRLWTRPHSNARFSKDGEVILGEPAVRYSRVYLPLGLRLRRLDATWIAEFCTDGTSWTKVGKFHALEGLLRAGMVLNSGIPEVSTEIAWDEVVATASQNFSTGMSGL